MSETRDSMTPMEKFYDAQVRELADQQPEAVRAQIEGAVAEPPAGPDEVNPWFFKHFHEPPVAHDTQLYNRLHGMKAALREAAGAFAD
jgi:hypothetical protein